MIKCVSKQLRSSLEQGTRLALFKIVLLFGASMTMSCLVTDKIEFRVVPPSILPLGPAAVSRRPAQADDECLLGGGIVDEDSGFMEFVVEVRDSLVAQPLDARLFINGTFTAVPPMPPPNGEVNRGQYRFCLSFGDLDDLDDACHKVELLVSHGFGDANTESLGKPLVEGDLDIVTWFVAVEQEPGSEIDEFQACLDAAEGAGVLKSTDDGGVAQ